MNAHPAEPLPGVEDWAARLGLRKRSGEYAGPCPVCGGRDRFHVGRGRGGAARVGCRGCIDSQPEAVRREAFGRVLRAAFPERFRSGAGDGPSSTAQPSRRALERDSGAAPCSDDAQRRKAARRIWDAAKPLAGTLAETYLHARGVGYVASVPALRFSPALSYPQAPEPFPCLVAGVQGVHGDFLGVQRTYLAADGADKANVEEPRLSLGRVGGGAVRLAEPEHGRLLVGEGIETTASAMALFELPGWAALGASGLQIVELPRCIRDVVIAADRDADGKGQGAAAALAEHLQAEGREVEIQLPPFVGDWNDVLLPEREAS